MIWNLQIDFLFKLVSLICYSQVAKRRGFNKRDGSEVSLKLNSTGGGAIKGGRSKSTFKMEKVTLFYSRTNIDKANRLGSFA